MMKPITKEEVQNIREQLKASLKELKENYITGAVVAPKGVKIENCTVVHMKVTKDDLEFFSLGLYVCDVLDLLVSKKYTTEHILYLLKAENDLGWFLNKDIRNFKPFGLEVPDYYFLNILYLTLGRIKNNLDIKVKGL